MRRLLTPLAAAATAIVIVATSGCGTLAAKNAAVVHGQAVSAESVNSLAQDGTFVRAVLGATTQTDPSVLNGDVARQALLFEMQRAALESERCTGRTVAKVPEGGRSTRAGERAKAP